MTEFDTHLGYAKLDAWAKFPNFQAMVRDVIVRQQALDRMMIGFNGTSAATQTDPVANPYLQDVNIGWLQQYRTQSPARVMAGGKTNGKVVIDPTANANEPGIVGDYATLDALVYDVVHSLIAPWFRRLPGLVVILGRNLMSDKYFPLLNQLPPSEQLAADLVISQKRIGGLQGMDVPFFPDNALMVTTLDNLSVYWQNGAVLVEQALFAEAVDRGSLSHAGQAVAHIANDIGPMITAVYGGRTPIPAGDAPDSVV